MKTVVSFFLIIAAILFFVPGIALSYFANNLSSKEQVMNANNTGIILLDRNNKPFFIFNEFKNIEYVPLLLIPVYLQKAAIVSEDKEFYNHPGISIKGILRSFIMDIKKGDLAYGGSTITQQLVKNSLLSQDKTVIRKYQEIVLSYRLEKEFSKDEILEMYLNSAYFGEGAFGVQNAAKTYFGKEAKDLSLAQSAYLISLLPSPSVLSPFSEGFERSKQIQKNILENMEKEGYITKIDLLTSQAESLVFIKKNGNLNMLAPHFALMVKQELEKKFGEEQVARSGFKVKTSIDLDWQSYTEEVVKEQVIKLKKNRVSNGSAIVINPKTGEVMALAGSYDWFDEKLGKVNMAISPRQPGSAFKPIVYAAAFEKKVITPGTVLKDKPTRFEGNYSPKNYDGNFRGDVLVRRALANSLNVPSVQVMSKLGVLNAVQAADRFGISTLDNPSSYGLSLVLGAGEVRLIDITSAYGVFANSGVKNEPVQILEIRNKYDKIIYKHKLSPKTVLSPEYAFLISSILSDSSARKEVFGTALDIPISAAVKTGTTENFRDSLTIGYTPDLVVGVWVGNNDNSAMDNVAGSLGAAPIWKSLVVRFLNGHPNTGFVMPENVLALNVCKSNGLLLKKPSSSAGYTEYFVKGTEPNSFCNVSVQKKPGEGNAKSNRGRKKLRDILGEEIIEDSQNSQENNNRDEESD